MGNLANKFKRIFIGTVFAVGFACTYIAIYGVNVEAIAAGGDVPPIVMTPHGSVNDFRKKLELVFYVPIVDISLHHDNSLNKANVTFKNRTAGSKVRKRRELKDFHIDDFYVSEAKSFLKKYAGMLGVTNIAKSLQLVDVEKRRAIGNVSVQFNINIHGFLLESSHIQVRFGSDDTLTGAWFNLPHITPSLYRGVKVAKDNMMPLEELKDVASRQFVAHALKEGWLEGTMPEDYKNAIDLSLVENKNNGFQLNDTNPYLVRWFTVNPRYSDNIRKGKASYGFLFYVYVNAVTGEVSSYRNVYLGNQDEGGDY